MVGAERLLAMAELGADVGARFKGFREKNGAFVGRDGEEGVERAVVQLARVDAGRFYQAGGVGVGEEGALRQVECEGLVLRCVRCDRVECQ